MSAYVVDKVHIDILVAAGIKGPSGRAVNPGNAWRTVSWYDIDGDDLASEPWSTLYAHSRQLDYTTADEVGAMLWIENMASVAYRYDDADDMPGSIGLTAADGLAYTWTDPRYKPTAVEALNALAGYEYQSCEHPGWNKSEAKRFCENLRHALINALPGIDEAPWTWSDRDLTARRAGVVA